MSIDEIKLSKSIFYTIVTNKITNIRNKISVVSLINSTKSKTIQYVLKKISINKRNHVKEVSMNITKNMGLAIKNCFPKKNSCNISFSCCKTSYGCNAAYKNKTEVECNSSKKKK